MKNIFILFISILFFNTINAQIVEKQSNISLGVQPSLSTNVKDIKSNDVEKLWKEYMEKYGKTKYNSKAKEFYTIGVRMNEVRSGDPVDVYAKFDEFADGVKMDFCFDLGNGFINKKSNPKEYDGASKFVSDFVNEVEKFKVQEKLDMENKNLDKINSKFKDAVKDNKDLHDKIVKYEDKIKEAENDIKANEILQSDLQNQIENQTEKIKQIQRELDNLNK